MARDSSLPLCLLVLLVLAAAASPQAIAAPAASIPASSNSRALLAAPPTAPSADEPIAVPRATLRSVLTSIFKWPSSVLTGFGSSPPSDSQSDAGDNMVFNTPAPGASTPASSSGASGSAGGSSTGTPGMPQMFQPLTDAGIAAINRLLAGNESSDGPYHLDTGLPPLQDLVVLNSTAEETALTLSVDRMQQLSRLSEPLGWVIRTFSVSGDALLKLRLSTDLQLIIRDVISNSISQSAAVPEEQVLTFAASNVSIGLGFDGVDWPTTDANATADQHPGLAAVRDALAQLTGGFDPDHIAVSFLAPPSPKAAPATGTQSRRMLQATTATTAAAAGRHQQQQQVVVYATFYNLDPANSTSLLQALGKQCTTAAQDASANTTSSSPSPLFAPLTALTPGTALTPDCRSEFQTEFMKQGVDVSDQAFAVTPTDKPQATVDLSVAVGLTSAQTLQNIHEKTGDWLNSSALNDILAEFNLTAVPTDFTEYLYDPVTGTFPQLPGLNLSSLMSKVMPGTRSDAGTAVANSTEAGKAGVVGKALTAGITVAAVASVAALAGVVWLLLRHRRLAAAAAETQAQLPSSTGGAGSSDNRRRRRRPRMYHSKYLTGADTAAASSDTAAPHTDRAAAIEQQKHHLERGDSVSSAVHFEADDAASDADASPTAAAQQQQASSSCDSSASSSSSTAAQGVRQQQRLVELQLYRAAGPEHGSGAASAYSLMHDRAGSSSLYEAPSSSDDLTSSRCEQKQLIRSCLGLLSGPGVVGESVNPIAIAPLPGGTAGLAVTDSSSSCKSRLAISSGARAYSMQRSVSATLLADAAAAVLAQQALARNQSAAEAPGLCGLLTEHSESDHPLPTHNVVSGQQMHQYSATAGMDEEVACCSLPAKTVAVSATTTPPATPVADVAAMFAAMDAQLAAAGSSGGGQVGVQPLGLSCWHQGGHVSGFIVPEAAAASGAAHVCTSSNQHQQQPVRPAAGFLSPFSMMEQQREYRRSSGCGSLSRFALQQQHARHSSGGGARLSPFASEKEQERISSSGCGDPAASFAQQQQQQPPQQHSSAGGGVVSPFALVAVDQTIDN